jgi:hypothetical protein
MIRDVRNIYSLFISAGLDVFDQKGPDFIKSHPKLKKRKHINKVFPSFGLKNFREKVTFTYIDDDYEDDDKEETFINSLLNSLADQIDTVSQNLHIIHDELPEDSNPIILQLMKSYSTVLKQAKIALQRSIIVKKDNNTKLVLTTSVSMGGNTILREGDSVFKIFHKINMLTESLLKKYPELKMAEWNLILPNPDSLLLVKQFHSHHFPNKDYYIVFSSEGDTGAWDIATMSMRGITSCQRWGNEDLRTCLIGSILSRYVGIIYFTSGAQIEKYGEKMIRRCIVRFGIHKETGEKFIILDRMFDSCDAKIAHYFIEALQKRTNLKILNYSALDDKNTELPTASDVKIPTEGILNQLDTSELPYMDTLFNTSYFDKKRNITDKYEISEELEYLAHVMFTRINYEAFKVPSIAHIIIQLLQNRLDHLILKTKNNNLNYKFSIKYINLKMLEIINSWSNYNVEEIFKLLFPFKNSANIVEHLQTLNTNVSELLHIFHNVILQYKEAIITYFDNTIIK